MRWLGAALAASVSLGTATATYRTGPPPGHTGAFGEPDCGACHFDAARDDPDGRLSIHAPSAFGPGEPYEITVELRHEQLAAAGFQLTTRFLDGPAAGGQAGTLEARGERTLVQEGARGVEYASHAMPGASPSASGVSRWTVRWTAPRAPAPVAVDVAAQVANDDDSEFGERLYRSRRVVEPAATGDRGRPIRQTGRWRLDDCRTTGEPVP